MSISTEMKDSKDIDLSSENQGAYVKRANNEFISEIKKIWNWVSENPVISGAVILSFGGLTILSYLLPLGFIPDFELTAVLGLLFLAAFLGLLQLSVIAGSLMMPSMLGKQLLADIGDDGKSINVMAAILISLLIWIGLFSIDIFLQMSLYGLVFLASLGSNLIFYSFGKKKLRRLNSYLFFFVVQGGSFFLAVLIFTAGGQTGLAGEAEWVQWFSLIVWCVFVSIANLILLRERDVAVGLILATGALLIWVLIWLTQSFSYMNGITIRKLRLGDITGSTITVAEGAASAIQAACLVRHLPGGCKEQEIQRGTTTAYVYENVTILSRLGNQYYLQLCRPEDDVWPCGNASGLRVAIEKKDVMGWSTKEPENRRLTLEKGTQSEEVRTDEET
jgi:hypothetical protein